jgi:hypothetical protein
MHKFVRILRLFVLILSTVACAPVAAPIQPTATAEPTRKPAPTLQLAPLDAAQVRSDVEALLQLQESRAGAGVVASAETLSYFFPAERESLWHMAEEASLSRLYADIHYRFDMDAGVGPWQARWELAKLYATGLVWDPYAP